LPSSDNASFGDDLFSEKVQHYQRHNMLAASLHPNTHRRNPRFVRFAREHGLDDLFSPPSELSKEAVVRRQLLYQRLCDLIWDPSSLGFDMPGAPLVAKKPPLGRKRFNVRISDLVGAGLLAGGETLHGSSRGEEFTVIITDDGRLQVPTGETYDNPSAAGQFVLGSKACPGWDFWHAQRDGVRVPIKDIRADAIRRGLVG
jgi:hypothetical protein